MLINFSPAHTDIFDYPFHVSDVYRSCMSCLDFYVWTCEQHRLWVSIAAPVGSLFVRRASLLPRCRTSWGGGWWWGLWRPPPSWSWPCVQTACPPAGECSRSSHWCSGSDLDEEEEEKKKELHKTATRKAFKGLITLIENNGKLLFQTQTHANVDKVWRTGASCTSTSFLEPG